MEDKEYEAIVGKLVQGLNQMGYTPVVIKTVTDLRDIVEGEIIEVEYTVVEEEKGNE